MNKHKTVIVTGAGTGIGRAVALRLGKDGYNVVLNGIQPTPLYEAAREIGDDRTAVVPADISQKENAESIVTYAVKTFGGVDVLVNNAGVVLPGTVDTLSDDAFDQMMNVNVRGLRFMTLAALPELRKTKGNIVNISSVSGIHGDWGMYGYHASKGAVSLLTQGLALDLGAEGVRVNSVAPTTTNTCIAAPIRQHSDAMSALTARIPMGRLVEPEEVAAAVAFLAGPDAAFITGAILPVDGGLSASNGQPNFAAAA